MTASTYRYMSRKRDESVLKLRIKDIINARLHYGYRRVHDRLRREGRPDNVKRVYRLYREEGLSLRLKRPPRNKAAKLRQPKQIANVVNELFDDRKLRIITWWTATRASAWPSISGRA
jgi:putative transposase